VGEGGGHEGRRIELGSSYKILQMGII
jgi:hypothetical protein